MNRRIFLALLLMGFTLTPGFVAAAPTSKIVPPCTQLSATFAFTLFQFTSQTTAIGVGTVSSNGQIIGSFSANYFNIEQKGNGIIQLNGQHAITLDGGTLLTFDDIHLQPDHDNPAVLQANSRLHIVDGTGAYAGATGVLHTHGAFNVVTLEGAIDFKGKVCVP
jgi:hypothetical protein